MEMHVITKFTKLHGYSSELFFSYRLLDDVKMKYLKK